MRGLPAQVAVYRALLRLGVVVAIAGLSACAAPLSTRPARFVPIEANDSSRAGKINVILDAVVQPSGGRRRVVEAGSLWQAVGRLAQGDVYQRVNGIFIIQARDVHEARLVISNGTVVGFYLPVEGTFSPAVTPVQLKLGGSP